MILIALFIATAAHAAPPCKIEPKSIPNIEIPQERLHGLVERAQKIPEVQSPEWDKSAFGFEVDVDNDGRKEIYLGYREGQDHVRNVFVFRELDGVLLYDKDFPQVREGYNTEDEFVRACGKTYIKNGWRFFVVEKKKMYPACADNWLDFYRLQLKTLRKDGQSQPANELKQFANRQCHADLK